ncbi:MAG: hypothetical protein K0R61_5566 [Microvirga sp.]|nr:hypothetical protein [Microvirga sp.]
MCTSIIEIARAEGMAKRGDDWFPLSQAVVAYDHARHAPLGDVITLDFVNQAQRYTPDAGCMNCPTNAASGGWRNPIAKASQSSPISPPRQAA